VSETIILGGGISGLLAAWVFREQSPLLIEGSHALGGNYTTGGLKYIRRTPAFEALAAQLDVPWKPYRPKGGIFINIFDVEPYPETFRHLPAWERNEIQVRHWHRTRGTNEGFTPTCMNDPMGEGDAEAMDMDHAHLIERLSSGLRHGTVPTGEWRGVSVYTGTRVVSVHPKYIDVAMSPGVNVTIPYKRLITTLPLPLMSKLAPWANLPAAPEARPLTVAFIQALPVYMRSQKAMEMDYIYTPHARVIHRISRVRETDGRFSWQAEAAGKRMPEEFAQDLPDAKMVLANLPGHLLPLPKPVEWPDTIAPLGRFAEWDTRSTAEKTLDRALALKAKWA
jgi:hypothetical protein